MQPKNNTQELSKKEKKRIYDKRFREANREKIKEVNKRYDANNREQRREYARKYRLENADRLRQYQRQNNHKRKAYTEKYKDISKERYRNIPTIKIACCLRARILDALRSTGITKQNMTEELLGCTIQEARQYIEKQWQAGMSWENHSVNGWHIDHIKPCASFDLADPDQQKQCFHYTNLRPLWSKDNIAKNSFYNGVKYYYTKVTESL
jgi:hypothetical protein